jgi:acetyl/propionyl-CoA carboxylase alpha subunit
MMHGIICFFDSLLAHLLVDGNNLQKTAILRVNEVLEVLEGISIDSSVSLLNRICAKSLLKRHKETQVEL